ncbi:LPD7 domain-containing protein [Microvirga sp. CF3062]|uniref:LPD7 domain-containing protein n=1 Tax=Microvirga sp. CF3062 TaxID=3110182 RepID=UPI002E79FA8D|nr:LPD7 domain-containing protein [Microvirga sp. CF3062]MEE1657867.1 LPD7 domain-containing protein [Microvirga sp. CF3062]
MARGFKTARALDFKAQLLADAAPQGFDASAWRDDLHMIKQPSPGQPTTRILLRDGGWCEIDGSGKIVRTWGTRGRADALAAALAEAGDWETQRLERTTTIARSPDAPRRERLTEIQAEALVHWWQDRGYSATAAPDGCWVQAGTSRIRDTGDHMEIHGPVSDEAIRATIIKAKEAWGGAAELTGRWSQRDQDRIWIEAQRHGVQLEGCKPSDSVRRMWEREQATTEVHTQTMSLVRVGTREAESLRAAAQGDPAGLGRLPPELRAFVTSYLDDDQRAELATSETADVVPELSRFRTLGREELARIEHRNAKRNQSTLSEPLKSDPHPATNDLAPVLE